MAVFNVIHHIAFKAVNNIRFAGRKGCCMKSCFQALAAWFHPDDFDIQVVNKWIEETNGVGSAANTGNDIVRQAFFLLENLSTCLATDDGLEMAHHQWIWVRANGGS